MKKYLYVFVVFYSSILSSTAFAQINLIPKPHNVKVEEGYFRISPKINFNSQNISDTLQNYLKDYIENIYKIEIKDSQLQSSPKINLILDKNFANEKPSAYSLKITENHITITAAEEIGLFYGIQTIFQLLPKNISDLEEAKIHCCEILDYPRFSWRGLNLDCGRHFMTKDFIKRYIDILAYYKFNTLHWHLTEDQGWRIEIKRYPKLTQIGAWRKEADGSIYGGYYTQDDIKEIVAYAKSRFINIVPEIEMPGHCTASLAAYPENSCTGGPFEVSNIWGVHKDVYCAGRDSTFLFLQNVLDEVISLFPGKYIHIGGDEVPKDRWHECPKCQARIKAEGLKDEHELQSYFIKRISNYLHSKGKEVIGWDEILEGGLAPGVIVQSWQSFQGAIDAAKQGHYSIVSPTSHTYFDADPDNLDLERVYSFNPIPQELNFEESKFILGSEANLWTEHAPQETVDSKLFPRLLALSEVLWSSNNDRNFEEFHERVKKAYNDLSARNIKYGRESKAFVTNTTYDKNLNEFIVTIIPAPSISIRYCFNDQLLDSNSNLYKEPIKINKSENLKIGAYLNDYFLNKELNLSFDFHKALNCKVTLTNQYDNRYKANGDISLVDGVRGTNNFHDGLWLGFEGVDFEAILDLGHITEISKIIPRFLMNTNSWIFLPEYVEVSLSNDGVNFTKNEKVVNNISPKNPDTVLEDYPIEFKNTDARYIKIKAKNMGVCPPWHPGAGGKTWLFIDEIVVK